MLTDEEMKGALDGWLLEFDRDPADREEVDKFVAIIREAERGKGEARGFTPEEAQAHSDALKATMTPTGRGLFSTPYADKVLEVATALEAPLMVAEWAEAQDLIRRPTMEEFVTKKAQALITAANDAAMKREEKS